MDIDYFDPRVLTGVILKRPLKTNLFGSFFKRRSPSAVEIFELHVKSRNITMPPAITNHAAGSMREGDTVVAGGVTAPRFRTKRSFSAADKFKMPAGLTPYDHVGDPVARAVAEDMDLHREEIDFATEIMCCQAMTTGKIVLYDIVEGKKAIQRFTVDFKRPASHNVVLSGGALWSSPTSDLLGSVDDWGLKIQEETGHTPSDLILGKNAWRAFRVHKDVKDSLDNRNIDIGHLSPRIGKKCKGEWNGLRVFVMVGDYTDIEGNTKAYLDPDCALLLADNAESVIEFGMPVDLDCTGPTEFFSKLFKQEDPSRLFTIAESRPLPWTKQPGWVVMASVV